MQASHASKWLYSRVLFDRQGLEEMIFELGDLFFFQNTGVVKSKEPFPIKTLLDDYDSYLKNLATNPLPLSSYLMTCDPNAVMSVEVREGSYLIKPKYPTIQMREFKFVMGGDQKIQSMVFGETSISWGYQFAYPQLFVDPDSKKVVEVLKEKKYLNSELFKKLQRFVRHHTKPVPLLVGEEKINATFRMSEGCNSWISQHKGLIKEGLKVAL